MYTVAIAALSLAMIAAFALAGGGAWLLIRRREHKRGVLMLLAAPAAAQTHPCDLVVPSSGVVASGAPAYVEFCQPAADAIDAATVYRNGSPHNLTGVLPVSPTANAAGLVFYRLLLGTMPPVGTYTYEVASWNRMLDGTAQEGPRGAPFALTVALQTARPTAPSRFRVSP